MKLEILYAGMALLAVATIGSGAALYLCRKRLSRSRKQVAKLEEELKAARTLDEVTGAFNYPFFVKMANVQIKLGRRHKWPMTLMIIDIEQLEKINVHSSFKTGDAVLKHLAESIKSVIRSSDVPGRFGGSGIFLLLPECGIENIETVFRHIERKRKESPLKVGNKIIDYKVSAGSVTMYGVHAQLSRMFELSEEALNRAKENKKELVKLDKEGVER